MTLRIKIGLLMFLAIIVIIASGFLSYRSLSSIVKSINADTQPDFSVYKIKEIASDLEKAGNSVRIYSISGEENDLQPYYYNINQINKKINQLRLEKKEDSVFIITLDTISGLIDDKLMVWSDMLFLYKNYDIEVKLEEISLEIDTLASASLEKNERKNLLRKLFTKKKKLEAEIDEHNEIKEKIVDIQTSNDSTNQLIKKNELELAKTSSQITSKLYDLISVIEKRETQKLEKKVEEAEKLSEETYIWIASFSIFGTVLALMALFIVSRFLRKSNAYQKALKESKKAAEDLVKAKEMFIANISHELRTPMNAISGFTEQLISSKENNKDYLHIIKSSSDHLLNLINELLDYSKLQAGKLDLEPVHFKTSDMVSELLSMFKIQTLTNQVHLNANIDPDVPEYLLGDVFRLKQIIINLLSNAIKFSPHGKVDLQISAKKRKEDTVLLEIKVLDNGIGIEKEKINTIFQDFTQEEADVSRKYGGTGLGLSIVKKLIEIHQGEIEVESTKNVGSVFTCKIPYSIGSEEKTISKRDIIDRPDLRGLTVLIVDDNEYNRKLLNVILAKWGAEVHEAENGMDAIENIKRTSYDFVFLDLRMPVLDGFKTAKFIRSGIKKSSLELPIYVTSALPTEEEKKKFKKLDINDFILKPVSESSVIKVLVKSKHYKPASDEVTKTELKDTRFNYQILDITELNNLAGGDQEFVNTMLKKLIDQTDLELLNLEKNIKKKDWYGIAEISHKIASPCRHVGALELLKLLKEMENLAQNKKDQKEIQLRFDNIKSNYGILKNEIESFLTTANVF